MYGVSFPLTDQLASKDFVLPIGKAKTEREGKDVVIISFSRAVGFCLDAAKKLEAEGISAEVLNLRSIRPLDEEAIVAAVKKCNRVVTVEEGWPRFGVGAEISALIMEEAFDYLDAPVERITGADVPMPYSEPIERAALPQVDTIVTVVKRVVGRA